MAAMTSPVRMMILDIIREPKSERVNAAEDKFLDVRADVALDAWKEMLHLHVVPNRFSPEMATALQIWLHRDDPKPVTRDVVIYELETIAKFRRGTIDAAIDRLANTDHSELGETVVEEVPLKNGSLTNVGPYENRLNSLGLVIRKEKQQLLERIFTALKEHAADDDHWLANCRSGLVLP